MSSAKPVCLVLGGGAGIGYSVARRWAKEGHQVNNDNQCSLAVYCQALVPSPVSRDQIQKKSQIPFGTGGDNDI